jgi:hypothetical protein
MKVILSRKGMDSEAGKTPSPILPDGTLLSFPIPDSKSKKSYAELFYNGKSLQDIIQELSPRFDFISQKTCHLDPDLYNGLDGRAENWQPAFGQCDASATHLDTMGVGVGDIFLFYGMYRQTEYRADGTLRYVRSAPIRHIIYGYMKVGEILRDPAEIKARCPNHPHAVHIERANNRLYLPEEYGTFHYDDKLVLTKPNQNSRRLWALPLFFAKDGISISWQGDNKPEERDGYAELNSVCRGQEFVITTTTTAQQENLSAWVDSLITR